jgi:hypothetical protein
MTLEVNLSWVLESSMRSKPFLGRQSLADLENPGTGKPGKPGDRRNVSSKIAQSAEGATQPSPDREVGVQVGMKREPRRARHELNDT